MTFGNLPDSGAAYLMPPEVCNDNMRALVVSDLKFGKVHRLGKTLPRLLRILSSIVVEKRATVLFLLGDVLEHAVPSGQAAPPKDQVIADITAIFRRFDALTLPIYWIPGADERKLVDSLKDSLQGNIAACPEEFIRLKHPKPPRGTYPSIFLTYSGGYQQGISEGHVKLFATTLKTHFQAIIKPDELLMVGCTAKYEAFDQNKVVALDQFSIDTGKLSYALITGERRFTCDYASVPMPDLS